MKKILSLMIVAGAVLAGCSDSFLDSDNLTKKDNTVFPKNTTDAEQLLTSVYTPLLGDIEYPFCTAFMQAELMSDERLGAGGTDDREAQAVAAFMKVQENQYAGNSSTRAYTVQTSSLRPSLISSGTARLRRTE